MTTHDPVYTIKQTRSLRNPVPLCNFYHNTEQKHIVEIVVKQLASSFDDAIVTEISPLTVFLSGRHHHQDYYRNHTEKAYCSFVITSKIMKLRALICASTKAMKMSRNLISRSCSLISMNQE